MIRISEALASHRGLGRAVLAAYGDAVVPQITEAIGRAMVQFEATPEFNRIGATLTMVNSRECDLTSTWPAAI
jgi:hypothetical protein